MPQCHTVCSSLPLDDYAKFEYIRARVVASRYQLVREMIQFAIEHEEEFMKHINGAG